MNKFVYKLNCVDGKDNIESYLILRAVQDYYEQYAKYSLTILSQFRRFLPTFIYDY